jgi:hypothetical protein
MTGAAPYQDFLATLSPEQRALYLKVEDVQVERRIAEQDAWEAEVIRHLPPGVAPMVNLLFDHLRTQLIPDRGVCCTGQAEDIDMGAQS